MEVNELVELARWVDEFVTPAATPYEMLVQALQQNASNTTKVPLRENLNEVRDALQNMPLQQLTYQQIDVLRKLKVERLLGGRGWASVEAIVKEGNFDPASAANDLRLAKNLIDSTTAIFKSVTDSLSLVNLVDTAGFAASNNFTLRVRFKEGVEIRNIVDLKRWSGEWLDIARGVALAAGEKPEDVEVKGATTGSLIVFLGATLGAATVISLILKQVASTVKSSMDIANSIEDFRMKRLLNNEIEQAMQRRREEIAKGGADAALQLVKDNISLALTGDVENALQKSIEKLFNFTSKGGEVDMIPPSKPEDGDSGSSEAAINAIVENIEETRIIQAATTLLIENSGDDKSN